MVTVDAEYMASVSKTLNLMRRMLANAPKEIDAELVDGWARILAMRGLTAAEVEEAALKVLAFAEFWPSPGKFLEAVRPAVNADLKAEGAWQKALDMVRQHGGGATILAADVGGDGHLLWALDRMGWPALCAELGEDNRSIKRADFVRLYRLALEQNTAIHRVAGYHELQNRSNGHDMTPQLCGRNDWNGPPIPPKDAHLMRERPALLPAQFGSVEGFTSLGDAIGEIDEREDEED